MSRRQHNAGDEWLLGPWLRDVSLHRITYPLRGHDPRCVRVIIREGVASVGYAIHGSMTDGAWCIEGPFSPEAALARARELSAIADLPIVLSTAGGKIARPPGRAHWDTDS